MGWPQYTYLALTFVGLGAAMARHGKPKTGTHDLGSDVFATLLVIGLLYAGGFFS